MVVLYLFRFPGGCDPEPAELQGYSRPVSEGALCRHDLRQAPPPCQVGAMISGPRLLGAPGWAVDVLVGTTAGRTAEIGGFSGTGGHGNVAADDVAVGRVAREHADRAGVAIVGADDRTRRGRVAGLA